MIVVTIPFPDERTGSDHLHAKFETVEEAQRWATLTELRYAINASDIVESRTDWRCGLCECRVSRMLSGLLTANL